MTALTIAALPTTPGWAHSPEPNLDELTEISSRGDILIEPADLGQFQADGRQAELIDTDLQFDLKGEPSLRVNVSAEAGVPHYAQLALDRPLHIEPADTCLIWFRMRALKSDQESGEGIMQVVIEDGELFDKIFQRTVSATGEWITYALPFQHSAAAKIKEFRCRIRVGHHAQELEITDFHFVNFGAGMTVTTLPQTGLSYPGMQADAPWRAEALRRIETIRRTPLLVEVTDAHGRAVSDAAVSIEMQQQRFHFGTAVRGSWITAENEPAAQRYREEVLHNFNLITFENDLKWRQWEQDPETASRALDWAKKHHLAVRGHCLVWPAFRRMPDDVRSYADDPARLDARINSHIESIVSATRGKIDAWDVLNEPFNNHEVLDILGEEASAKWFHAAKRSDPHPKLFLNDWGIITSSGYDVRHQDQYIQYARMLRDSGAPLEGLGLQAHFGLQVTHPQRVLAILDRLAELKLDIHITEYSCQIADLKHASVYFKDLLIAAYSHPSVSAFILWGFYDGADWKDNGALFDLDWRRKPSGEVWQELVRKRWWTNEKASTNQLGRAQFRPYHGTHLVTVTHGAQRTEQTVEIGPEAATLRITLPASAN